jgi:hypothetical protein
MPDTAWAFVSIGKTRTEYVNCYIYFNTGFGTEVSGAFTAAGVGRD